MLAIYIFSMCHVGFPCLCFPHKDRPAHLHDKLSEAGAQFTQHAPKHDWIIRVPIATSRYTYICLGIERQITFTCLRLLSATWVTYHPQILGL